MFRSFESIEKSKFDVCIIGAGAAGITIADQLDKHDLSICLLEGGDLDYARESQSVYKGMSEGYLDDLDTSRLRYFGGTTNHWSGYCRRPNPFDFEERKFVVDQGWPIKLSELDYYFKEAAKVVEVVDNFNPLYWQKELGKL